MVVTVPDTPRAYCPAHGKPVAGSQPSHVAGQHVNCSHPKARASRQAGNRELLAGAALCYVPCSHDIWLLVPTVVRVLGMGSSSACSATHLSRAPKPFANSPLRSRSASNLSLERGEAETIN